MTSQAIENLAVIAVVLFLVFGCSEYDRTEMTETRRGDILCVHKAGIKKGYGDEERYNLGKKIYVGDRELKPEDYKDFNGDVASCEWSPDESVLVLKILNVDHERGGTYLLRSENGKPALAKIAPYDSKNQGEWTTDGRWLIFKEYFVNVETGERREIKGWKNIPDYYALANVSPDLKTIVVYGDRENEYLILKLIDVETGIIREQKFDVAENAWLVDKDHSPHYGGPDYLWISSHFKWERNADGKDKLVYPVAVSVAKKYK